VNRNESDKTSKNFMCSLQPRLSGLRFIGPAPFGSNPRTIYVSHTIIGFYRGIPILINMAA
jgi:hypothetical protein